MQNRFDLPKSVIIGDKTLRDGIQPEEKSIPTQAKIFLANELVDAGFRSIEIGQYLPLGQDLVQFHDVSQVLKGLKRKPGVETICLAANRMGVDLAVRDKKDGFGADWLNITLSDSEEQTMQLNTTHDEVFNLIKYAVQTAKDVGLKVRSSLMVSWDKSYNLEVDLRIIDRLVNIGITQIDHTDPNGIATPQHIFEHFTNVSQRYPQIDHCLHCHDTRGLGIANYLAAMQAGIRRFDTTMGGIGGFFTSIIDDIPTPPPGTNNSYCISPGRTGMVCTEDFVMMCNKMGIETGIDMDKTLNIGEWVERIIGRRLWSLSLPWGNDI